MQANPGNAYQKTQSHTSAGELASDLLTQAPVVSCVPYLNSNWPIRLVVGCKPLLARRPPPWQKFGISQTPRPKARATPKEGKNEGEEGKVREATKVKEPGLI